jgi:hypothetical protein
MFGEGKEYAQKPSAMDALRRELEQVLGPVERQILSKVELRNIDPDEEDQAYHLDILRGLIQADEELGASLIGHMLRETGLTPEEISRILIEKFRLEDISFGIGTKRNVDRIIMELTDNRVAAMTASLDVEPVEDLDNSPSYQEAMTLEHIDTKRAWCVQEYYGYTTLKDRRGERVLICKEFIPGQMLANATVDLEMGEERLGRKFLSDAAYAVGKMAANALTELGGLPRDSHPMNIIIDEDTNGNVIARYCDVEEIRRDALGIGGELRLLQAELGPYAKDFLRGLTEHFSGDLTPYLQKSAA